MSTRPDITPGPPLTVAEAAAQVVREQTRELRRQGKRVRKDGASDAVHDMRVATRRIRVALRSLRGHVGAPKSVRRGVQDLGESLGRLRDHDVILALLESSRPKGALPDERARLAKAVRKLRKRRTRVLDKLARSLRKKDHRRLLDALDQFAEAPSTPEGDFTLATRALAEAGERLGAAVSSSRGMTDAAPEPKALHALRIAFKRLRYALDFHAAASGLAYDVERNLARAMQDVLGEIHDRDILLGLLSAGKGVFRGKWQVLSARLVAERARLLRRFRRLRKEWRECTRPEPQPAPIEPPRFVNLEVQPVTLRLVNG